MGKEEEWIKRSPWDVFTSNGSLKGQEKSSNRRLMSTVKRGPCVC